MKNFILFLIFVGLLYFGFTYFSKTEIKEKTANSAYKRAGVGDLAEDGVGLGAAIAGIQNDVNSVGKDIQKNAVESIPEKIESWFISLFNKHVANSDKDFFEE